MPHVLVVDDEPLIRRVIADMLTPHGYDVREAATAREAQCLIQTEPPDLILLDLLLPDLDGWSFVAWCRTRSANRTFPIVMITAQKEWLGPVAQVAQQGVQAALVKPFRMPQLLAAVQQWYPVAAN